MEAAGRYCSAFGAERTFEMKNRTGDAYEHCELSVDGELFLAVSEAANPCDVDVVHREMADNGLQRVWNGERGSGAAGV